MEAELNKMSHRNKRQRAANFTPHEKALMLKLIYNQRHIIGNKRTDALSNKQKMRCWEQITDEFNKQSPSGVLRSSASIRKFYTNKKKEVPKEVSKRRVFVNNGEDASAAAAAKRCLQLALATMSQCSVDDIKIEDEGAVESVVYEVADEEVDDKDQIDVHCEELVASTAPPSPSFNDVIMCSPVKSVDEKSTQTSDSVSQTVTKSNPKDMAIQTVASKRKATSSVSNSSTLSEMYYELAEKKMELVQAQIAEQKREEERRSAEFKLKQELLQLEIEMKREELRRFKCAHMKNCC